MKNPTLQVLHQRARELLRAFDEVAIEHIPREMNADADRLANEGVDAWLAGPGSDYRPPEPPPPLFDE